MHNDIIGLLKQFEPRGILLDANLLIVYVVALVDISYVGKVRRTEAFGTVDARLLHQIMPRYSRRVTTPGILAEASNLLEPFFRSLHRSRLGQLRVALREEISVLDERHVPAKSLASDEALFRFGFSDLAIAALAGNDLIVITADVELSALLERRNLPCINYNHIRFNL